LFGEVVSNRFSLVKVKAGDHFNRRNTLSISRIENAPLALASGLHVSRIPYHFGITRSLLRRDSNVSATKRLAKMGRFEIGSGVLIKGQDVLMFNAC
jgi:hypothetical protein